MEQEDNKKEFGSLLEDFLNKKIDRRDFMKGLVALGLAGGLLNSWINMADASSTPTVKSGARTAHRRAVESWDDEYDVIIAGTGAAGLATAIEAYDNGADNILVLEKNMEPGGSTRRCGGWNCREHKQRAVQNVFGALWKDPASQHGSDRDRWGAIKTGI